MRNFRNIILRGDVFTVKNGFRKFNRLRFRNRKFIPIVAVALILVVTLVVLLSHSLPESAVSLAKAEVESTLRKCVNSAVSRYFTENPTEKLYTVGRNGDGEITSLTLDAAKANKFKAEISEYIGQELENAKSSVCIPAGSLTDNILLSGKGRKIKIRILSEAYVRCDISTSLSSAGVNQALHEVYVTVTVGATSRVGKVNFDTTAEEKLLISQVLVVGKIPDTFASF